MSYDPTEEIDKKRAKARALRDAGKFAEAEHLYLSVERDLQKALPKIPLGPKTPCDSYAAYWFFPLWLDMSTLYSMWKKPQEGRDCCQKLIDTVEVFSLKDVEHYYLNYHAGPFDARSDVALAYNGIAYSYVIEDDIDKAFEFAEKAYETFSGDSRISNNLRQIKDERERRYQQQNHPTKVTTEEERHVQRRIWRQEFTNSSKDTAITVFVSSTFKDMIDERDQLILRVFPQLRQKCEERSLSWADVDLRWGIPDNEIKEGKLLPICLAQIERCEFFIGILGDRYGSLPETIPSELFDNEKYEWLKNHTGSSVTEIEMLHAVLRPPGQCQHAFFYLKELSFPGTANDGKLEKLKDQIKKESQKNPSVSLSTYRDPEHLAETVLQDFSLLIDKEFPVNKVESVTDRNAKQQHAWLRKIDNQLSSGLLPDLRDNLIMPIQEALSSGTGGGIIAVSGPSGSGKTVTIARAALWAEKSLPDALIVPFFKDAGSLTDTESVITYLHDECTLFWKIDQRLPKTQVDTVVEFTEKLHLFGQYGKTIIIIDGMEEADPPFKWMPDKLPPGVFIILAVDETLVTKLPDSILLHVSLPPLTDEERSDFVQKYLDRFGKKLIGVPFRQLISTPACAHTGFLRTMLDELRLHGSYETFSDCFSAYLRCPDLQTLYLQVCKRVEELFNENRKGLVVRTLNLIDASRTGLYESELLDLLGEDQKPLPQHYWRVLALNLAVLLNDIDGVFRIANRDASAAISLLNKANGEKAPSIRKLLAYFWSRPSSSRRSTMLCRLLRDGSQWDDLYRFISGNRAILAGEINEDVTVLNDLFLNNFKELEYYWAQLIKHLGKTPLDGYDWIIKDPQKSGAATISAVLFIFCRFGYFAKALDMISQLTPMQLQALDDSTRDLLVAQEIQSLQKQGRTDEALKKSDELERLIGKSPEISLIRGEILVQQFRYEEALRVFTQTVDRLNSKIEKGQTYGTMAFCYAHLGDYQQALSFITRAEEILSRTGDRSYELKNDYYRALIMYKTGEFEKCYDIVNQNIILYRETTDEINLQLNLQLKGISLLGKGTDYASALSCLKEQEEICRRLDLIPDLSSCLNNQHVTYKQQGKFDEAIKCLDEELQISTKINSHVRIVQNHFCQAHLYLLKGLSRQAMDHVLEGQKAAEQYGLITEKVVPLPILREIESQMMLSVVMSSQKEHRKKWWQVWKDK